MGALWAKAGLMGFRRHMGVLLEGTRALGGHRRGAAGTWRFNTECEHGGGKLEVVAVVDRPCQRHDHGITQRRCTFQLRRLGCQWVLGANQRNCVLAMVYAKAYMTNRPSLVILPEAMELSRTTFACPSWRLSGVAGTKESACGARWARTVHVTK